MSSPNPPAAATPPAVPPGGGAVFVTARWAAGRIVDCTLASRRPEAARLLAGKSAPEVLALVPRLFSLCGQAQRAVAAAALAAAGRTEAPPPDAAAGLRREAIGEHLWRLLIDWPTRLSQPPAQAEFAGWYRRLRSKEAPAELAAALLAATGPARLAPLLDALAPWDVRLDFAPNHLPRLDATLAADLFASPAPGFAATPSWRGIAAEVGAMSRFAGHPEVAALNRAGRPLAARLFARWLALRDELEALAAGADAATPALAGPDGLGVAWAETSRGPLCHRVVMERERVVDYAVIAPTEWNFHPAIAWAAGLAGTKAEAPEIAENLLRLWALALDPCVPLQLTLTKEP